MRWRGAGGKGGTYARVIARILDDAPGQAVVSSCLGGAFLLTLAYGEETERRTAYPFQSTPCGAGTRGDGCAPFGAPSRRLAGTGPRFLTDRFANICL